MRQSYYLFSLIMALLVLMPNKVSGRDIILTRTENMESNNQKMIVEVWSDIMCPFCYIGKRHYEAALKQFANREYIELVWKSYQLDPSTPEHFDHKVNAYQYLADKKGMSYEQSISLHKNVVQMASKAGLDYNFDLVVVANSFKAHRIIQLAKTKNLGDYAEEIFFKSHFIDGGDLNDEKTLYALGNQIGLSDTEVKEALGSDEYAYKVKQDIQEAQNIGVRGVPFFVFNRKYAVSGAQPVASFLETIETAYAEWRKDHPIVSLQVTEGPSCSTDGVCE